MYPLPYLNAKLDRLTLNIYRVEQKKWCQVQRIEPELSEISGLGCALVGHFAWLHWGRGFSYKGYYFCTTLYNLNLIRGLRESRAPTVARFTQPSDIIKGRYVIDLLLPGPNKRAPLFARRHDKKASKQSRMTLTLTRELNPSCRQPEVEITKRP